MAICTQCGQPNPDEARFCMACAQPLAVAAPPREERKVVSVLFCDLVGSTAAAHSADPEDVRRILSEYHTAVRGEIERFGGKVEKFIGDAAVGVWGVPRTHEDDAERAIRAALAILEVVPVEVRIAVNTGEVLAALDPTIDPGEGIVGDVMNTAARMQAVAPLGGILAGEGTVRLTRDMVEYEQLAPVILKGKPEPVGVWQVVALRPDTAESGDVGGSLFVGRTRELRLLQDVFERALAEPGPQLVSVVGEPGIGKSRLLSEFGRWLDGRGMFVRLRGRCLAYGDGVGFWPLEEIVKQHLRLTETDSEEQARAKLAAAVEGMEDAGWIRARLAPLVGLRGESGDREEVFAAWQRFFDEIAGRQPLALTFEDLHWADPAMLAFVNYVAEWSTGVPILVLCTARPEIFESHPGWAGGLPNATTLALRPLSDTEAVQLSRSLLGRALGSADAEAALVERCGGNPLYAEEYARLLAERSAEALSGHDMPETVQALIAARIDTLDPIRKDLLHDAAVIGKTFWSGAVVSLAGSEVATRTHLHELARKELIRRVRVSSIPGDEEYSFWHDLVHQVAYQQIPRAERAEKHRRAAQWIERIAGDRAGDRAELLAHHYGVALELAPSTSDGETEPLRRATVEALTVAGARARDIDVEHAERLLRQGLNLAVSEDAEYPRLLQLLAETRWDAGHLDEARALLLEARAAAERHGDVQTLGAVLSAALNVEFYAGNRARIDALAEEAIQRMTREPPSAEYARILAIAGFQRFSAEEFAAAEPLITEGIRIAEETHDPLGIALATNFRGLLRSMTGDRGGLDDLQASLDAFLELGSGWAVMRFLHRADGAMVWDRPNPVLFDEAISHAAKMRGSTADLAWSRAEKTWCLADLGDWDEVITLADEVLTWAAEHDASQPWLIAAPQKARVLAWRGQRALAREVMTDVLAPARRVGDPQVLAPALAASALTAYLEGDHDQSQNLLDEIGLDARCAFAPTAEICRLLIRQGKSGDAEEIVAAITSRPPRVLNAIPTVRGLLSENDGEMALALRHYQDATERWRAWGHALELAHALAGQARCLNALDRSEEAHPLEGEATTILEHLGVRYPILQTTEI